MKYKFNYRGTPAGKNKNEFWGLWKKIELDAGETGN